MVRKGLVERLSKGCIGDICPDTTQYIVLLNLLGLPTVVCRTNSARRDHKVIVLHHPAAGLDTIHHNSASPHLTTTR